MTVAELIAALQRLPPQAPIYVWDDDDYADGALRDPNTKLEVVRRFKSGHARPLREDDDSRCRAEAVIL